MNVKQKLFFLGLALGSSLFFSCSEEEESTLTSIGTGPVKIGMGVKIPVNSATGARLNTAGLNVNSGFLQIKDLELNVEGSDKSGNFQRNLKLKFPEIKKINFNELDAGVDFFINIPAGNYKEIEFEIDVIDNLNEPSIQLEGTFQYLDGRAVPFKFQVFGNDDDDFDFDVELKADKAEDLFNIQTKKNAMALLEISAKGWFSTITTAELEKAIITEGILLINKDKNPLIYKKAETRIKASTDIQLKLK